MPLLVHEPVTPAVQRLYARDPQMLVWWAGEIECVSAIARMERAGDLSAKSAEQALSRLDVLAAAWHEIAPLDAVRRTARRLLRVHAMRAGDAQQLAAALVAAEQDPTTLEFVCLDERLAEAARREGFPVVADD